MTDTLDKFAAGELLRRRREEKGLTQEKVVENTTVPVAAYLSELENGKVNVARSKHFASLAAFLSLSEDDIRAINPSAVFATQPQPTREADAPDSAAPPELEAALVKAAQLYPVYNTEVARAYLTHMYNFDGIGPQTEDEWLDVALSLRPILERGPHGR